MVNHSFDKISSKIVAVLIVSP
jgi:hypothetical protein